MEHSTGAHCWGLQKVIDRDIWVQQLLCMKYLCTGSLFQVHWSLLNSTWITEPLGTVGNEADHFQLMCAIEKQLKYNELAISEMRNTMAANTTVYPLQDGWHGFCWLFMDSSEDEPRIPMWGLPIDYISFKKVWCLPSTHLWFFWASLVLV